MIYKDTLIDKLILILCALAVFPLLWLLMVV